jgi:hypothetical protein
MTIKLVAIAVATLTISASPAVAQTGGYVYPDPLPLHRQMLQGHPAPPPSQEWAPLVLHQEALRSMRAIQQFPRARGSNPTTWAAAQTE